MKKTTFRTTLTGAALMLLFASAHAGITVNDETASSQESNSVPYSIAQTIPLEQKVTPKEIIEYVGKMPSSIYRVSIKMKNAPIAKVLSLLAPKGWSGYASDPRIKTIGTISFNGGGRQWPVVLEEILKHHGLIGLIDWEKHELSIGVSEDGVR